MIKLDKALLADLGLEALDHDEASLLLKHIYETLESRVGKTLADKMTESQLSEFEILISNDDEAEAFRWLKTNFPNYSEVVSEKFEELKIEIAASAPEILQLADEKYE